MAQRDIFSKHLPNVKLATSYDSEGKEVQVERREDVDATAKEQETFNLLVNAGYYRAKIKGLSEFDKVVGGMTWCIECSDYDVDVDLLFHENLTIGQKIALVEKIVAVLPQMKCPFRIEPHQIQGLEFLSIHPVIQWLVKKSVENRAERAQRLKKFAIGQFHNNYQYKTDFEKLARMRNAAKHVKRIQELYSPCRQYQRKDAAQEDESLRVRMTLLEYGNKHTAARAITEAEYATQHAEQADFEQELDVDQLLQNLHLSKQPTPARRKQLKPAERKAMHQHYAEFKEEMETDAKQLSEQSQTKIYEGTKAALQQQITIESAENNDLQAELEKQRAALQLQQQIQAKLQAELSQCKLNEKKADVGVLEKVQELLQQHDDLKREESEFKEFCRQNLADLQKEIDDLEALNAQNPEEQEAALHQEKARMAELRLQLAKKNRGIVAIQRKLDAIPDRTELTQYQRRFHELYNEISAKHLETKQYYTLFNTLNDKKRYLEKELSLLNSICEAYKEGMMSAHGRAEFIRQFEAIVATVKQNEQRVRSKYNEEREKRNSLNEELQALVDLQRQYAAAVKQLTKECQRCEQLQQHLKSIQRK